jgi:hypothetical protein
VVGGLRLVAVAALATFGSACAVVLDIQEASLEPGDAAEADTTKPQSDVKPAPGCQTNGEACNDCLASACCQQYSGCLADEVCNQALVTYDMCASAAPDGGGSTCAETFGTANSAAQSLVQCAFFTQCKTDCSFKRLRSSCAEYCSCMEASCVNATWPQGTCMESCLVLTTEQLDCRAYHCQFAASDPSTHCPHALGISVCP